MHLSKTTGVLIILGLLVLGAAAYLLFGADGSKEGVAADAPPATPAEQTFLALTSRIDPVTLDTSILDDPRFAFLQDMRVSVIPETSGRIDPFAPLGR
jgi:hypothetical protein